jgi:YVTN family beta-propeller protein
MPQQRPKKQDNVEGRMVIARNINWSPPTYLRNALTSPMVAHRAAALDDLAHLYRIGNDVVRARVTTELEHLTNDDSRAVSTAAATLLTNLPTTAPPATPAISATSATSATGEAPPTSAHPAPPEPATPPPVPAEAASPASAEAAPPAPAEVVPLAPVEAARLALTEAAPPALAEDVPPALAEDAPLASPAEPEPPRRTARVARVARPDPAARRARLLPAVAARVRGLRRVPVRGWLAGAAALLLVAAVVVAVVRGYARSWPAEFAYQVGITPLLVGAAVCLLLPRTRRLVGPGLLLGATAAAGWGLVYVVEQLVIDARPSMRNLGDPPAWLMLAGLALAVAAAGWTVLALVRDPAVRLEPRRPRSVRTAVPVAVAAGAAVFSVIGMTGVLRTFANLHVVYLGPVYGIVAHASIATAALAVAVPVWVAVLVPHALRLSVLGGWAGGALAVGASTLDVTDWTPADHPGELVFAGGALVLLGAAAVAGRRATTRPVPVRRSALLAGLAVLCLLATGGGLTLYRVAAAPVTTAVPWSLAVSPDGHRLYVAGGLSTTGSTAIGSARPGRVWVIDAATRHPVGRAVAVGHGAANVAVSRDGRYAYVSNAGDDSVSVISTPERATVGDPVRVGAQPTSLRLAGSRLLVVNAGSHDVSVLDTTTNEVTGTRIPLGHDPGAVTFTQDGTRAYVASGKQGDIACLDTATGKATCPTMLLGEEVQALAVSPDGTRLYATSISNDGSGVQDHLSIFDTGTGLRRADPIPLDAGPQFSITVSHDGNRVYVPNFFGESISVIDPRLGAPVGSPVPVGGAPGAVALSPHDDRVWVTLPSDGKLATFPTTNPTTITTTTITP